MSRADYAHWNEEADAVWWAEEGRHVEDEPYDDESWRDEVPDDDEVEHFSEADCIADGNFSRPSSTGIWECDGCGMQYPSYGEWPPTVDSEEERLQLALRGGSTTDTRPYRVSVDADGNRAEHFA